MKAHELEGRLALVMVPVETGVQEVLGTVMPPMMLTETGEVTHATVTGMVLTETVHGLPIPVVIEEPVELEMWPVTAIELM